MDTIKLILVDIDGTLLNDEGIITPKTKEAIKKLKDTNIKFGIATGRTPYAVRHLIKDWGIENSVDMILGFNGGCYLDLHTNTITSHYLLDGSLIPEIFEDFKQFTYNAGIYDAETFHVLRNDELATTIANANKLPMIIDDFSQYFDTQIEKMIFIANNEEIDKMNAYYQTLSNKKYKAIKSTPKLLEFLNPELSKSKGIEKLCKSLNISPDCVLTFGDELNDYEMIKDFIGVAMDNANPIIKEVASYTTNSNNDDGIGEFLNTYILK